MTVLVLDSTEILEKTKLDLDLDSIKVEKAVVLHSGGIDSSTLLYDYSRKYECYPLSIEYGQKHSKETQAAGNVVEALGLLDRWKLLKLPALGKLLPSALTVKEESIPEGHYNDDSMKKTVVPNRNLILLSIAAGYAQGIGARYLLYAPHKGDHTIYPDCRFEFVESASKTIKLGTGWSSEEGITLIAPYLKYSKADIVALGYSLGVPYELTWSCYQGQDRHCGKCGTCVERKEAFFLAGVKDPTDYEN